jgi:hypothetical protein
MCLNPPHSPKSPFRICGKRWQSYSSVFLDHETSWKSVFSQNRLNGLWKEDSHEHYGVFRFALQPHKCLGTRLKSVQPICQILSVASKQFGLHTLWKGETLLYVSCFVLEFPQASQDSSEGLLVPVERNEWKSTLHLESIQTSSLFPHVVTLQPYYKID